MRVLVTGANGLLGSHLLTRLVSSGNEVYGLVHTPSFSAIHGVNYHIFDLSQEWSDKGFPKKLDAIIHLAQSKRFREFPGQAKDIFSVNVAATANLLNYGLSSGIRHFILASSGGIYGAGKEAFRENTVIPHHGKLGYYLGSKLCAEVLAQNYSSLMSIKILRPFFMYGPGQKRSMLIPRLIDNIIAGSPIALQGEQGIRINPIHVSDAVLAVEKCLSLEGSHTFNVAGSEIMSLREIAEIIGFAVGRGPIYDISNIEPEDLIANIDALKSFLSVPKIRFCDGVQGLIPR